MLLITTKTFKNMMEYTLKIWSQSTDVQELEFDGGHMQFNIESIDKEDKTVCFSMAKLETTISFYLTKPQCEEIIKHLSKQVNN